MSISEIPCEVIYVACVGGFCYFVNFCFEIGKEIVSMISKLFRKKKHISKVSVDSDIDDIVQALNNNINKIYDNIGKEERL